MVVGMEYRLNPDVLGEIFAVPAAVVDNHIKLAGSAQLKVLLWLLRGGKGVFDAQSCSKAIGLSPADCSDALQYWYATGVLLPKQEEAKDAAVQPSSVPLQIKQVAISQKETAVPVQEPVVRPRPVKPQMKEVIARQKESSEFAYLLETASARLGRPVSQGDMETLLYLYDTAGLPVEVIMMVIEYAISEGKYHMRYIEKVALDWADRGITTISAAEEYLCALDRRRQAWNKVSTALGLAQSPTIAESDAAERWIYDWKTNEDLLRLAYQKCLKATGKFKYSYINKILERWRLDGIDTVEKAASENEPSKRKGAEKKKTSFDLDEYEKAVNDFTPVYKK